jgi:hypothetical protein
MAGIEPTPPNECAFTGSRPSLGVQKMIGRAFSSRKRHDAPPPPPKFVEKGWGVCGGGASFRTSGPYSDCGPNRIAAGHTIRRRLKESVAAEHFKLSLLSLSPSLRPSPLLAPALLRRPQPPFLCSVSRSRSCSLSVFISFLLS